MTDRNDELSALLARVGLRDQAAFSKLYTDAAPKLFGICLHMLRDRREAEDALQEIFVKIWHRAGQFRPEAGTAAAWLNTVARHHAIDRLRASRRAADGLDSAESLADPSPGPEAEAIIRSEGRRIDGCMQTLPRDRAEAVRLAYVEGASYDDLAQRYSVPLNTMRSWLRRSLIKLRDCLSPLS